jgi:hypothetical protein
MATTTTAAPQNDRVLPTPQASVPPEATVPDYPPLAPAPRGPSRGTKWIAGIAAAVVLLAGGVVGGALLLGGGDDSSSTAATVAPTATDVPATVPATDTGTGTDIDAANQRLIDQFASTSGGRNLAKICRLLPLVGRAQAVQTGTKELGPLVIKQGGQPSVVVNGLLDRC